MASVDLQNDKSFMRLALISAWNPYGDLLEEKAAPWRYQNAEKTKTLYFSGRINNYEPGGYGLPLNKPEVDINAEYLLQCSKR